MVLTTCMREELRHSMQVACGTARAHSTHKRSHNAATGALQLCKTPAMCRQAEYQRNTVKGQASCCIALWPAGQLPPTGFGYSFYAAAGTIARKAPATCRYTGNNRKGKSMEATRMNQEQQLDELQKQCNYFSAKLREEGRALPPEERALQAASRYPSGSNEYMVAYMQRRVTDLKNQFLYNTID